MTIRVSFVGLDRAKRSIRGLGDDLVVTKGEVRTLLRALGRGGRDIAKKQITTQGGGNWPKLSKWTRARTGRRRALTTERERITFRLKPAKAEVVYAERSNDWNLTKHHKGFTTKGTRNKRVTVPLRNPAVLRVKRPAISFKNSQDSVTPARNVWGTQAQHNAMAQAETDRWVRRLIAKRR